MLDLTTYSGLSPEVFIVAAALLMLLNSSAMFPPSEYICLFAGAFWRALGLPVAEVLALTAILVVANYLGTTIWYFFGRASVSIEAWYHFLFPRRLRVLDAYFRHLPAVGSIFSRWGSPAVLLFRCVPVLRSIVSHPAGLIGMPFGTFTVASIVGIWAWCTIWVSIGYMLGLIDPMIQIALAIAIGVVSVTLFLLISRKLG